MNKIRNSGNKSQGIYSPIVIVGAGAAGMFCAWLLGRAGLDVAILDGSDKAGRKLASSGGGFANFSNVHMSAAKFLCYPYPDFCEGALSAFSPGQILSILKQFLVPFTLRPDGRYFLEEKAPTFARRLQEACEQSGVIFAFNERAHKISSFNNKFQILTDKNQWICQNLVLAIGSPAHPHLAAGKVNWDLASALGHQVRKPIPALMPLFYPVGSEYYQPFKNLAGISVNCEVWVNEDYFHLTRDKLLFTHKGVSGPAILTSSLYWKKGDFLHINFLPGLNFEMLLDDETSSRKTPSSILCKFLPDRLANILLPCDLAHIKNAQLSRKNRKLLGARVNRFPCPDLVASGLDYAEVCSGGVNTSQIARETMQSKLWHGLYFIGEMVDVTGELGGYNLHWAWASAAAAAASILGKK